MMSNGSVASVAVMAGFILVRARVPDLIVLVPIVSLSGPLKYTFVWAR